MNKELWEPITEYENIYSVSSLGRVRSERRMIEVYRYTQIEDRVVGGKILKPSISRGYTQIKLYKDGKAKSFKIHRLVLLAFVGSPQNGMESCHNNGIKKENYPKNLRWGTHKENCQERTKHGVMTGNKGEKHPQAKLNNLQARIIKRCLEFKVRGVFLAKTFGVTKSMISRIKLKKAWM